ncbi:MAG: FliH/SctL family protein [Candidatus Sericytochromatia bacterium]|nr:FliH/SctL family protein [Candidatus Sericytochromatia bacterium]
MDGSPFRSPNVFRDLPVTERGQAIPGPKTIFTVEDGESLRARITGEAEAVRQRMLAEATAEAAVIRAQAQREGVAAARAEAEESVGAEWRARWQEALDSLQAAADQILGLRAEWLEGLDRELADLALTLAARVLGREASQPETTRQLALAALDRLSKGHILEIRVAAALSQVLGGSVHHPRWGEVRLVPDPDLRPGDVQVSLEGSLADARLASMLEELATVLEHAAPEIPEWPLELQEPAESAHEPAASHETETPTSLSSTVVEDPATVTRRVPSRRAGSWLS